MTGQTASLFLWEEYRDGSRRAIDDHDISNDNESST